MRAPKKNRLGSPRELFVDLLTFDRRLAVPVIHLVYWAGLGLIALIAFSFVGAFVIGKAIDMTIGFRLDEDSEVEGIDLNEHAESGYDLTAATRGHRGLPGTPPVGAPEPQDARHDAGDKGSVNA